MLYTKVRNKSECGINLVTVSFGNFYGTSGLRSKRLAVKHVQIVQNNSEKHTQQRFGGLAIGAFFYGGFSKVEGLDVELDLYLVDGRVVEIWTKDPSVLRAAEPYMTIQDPREKYREMRNPTIIATKVSRAEQNYRMRLDELNLELGELDAQMTAIKDRYFSEYGMDCFTDDAGADRMLDSLLHQDKIYQSLNKRAIKVEANIQTYKHKLQVRE